MKTSSIFPTPAYNTKPHKKCEKIFSLKLNNEIHDHNSRSKNKIHIARTRHSFAQKYQRQNLPHTINNIPVHVLNRIKTHSIQRITNDINELCIANNSEECTIETAIYIYNKTTK